MKRPLLATMLLALAACSSQQEETYSVDDLMADETLLATLIGECRNDPGELRNTANCRNAEAADGKRCVARMRKDLGG